LVPGERRRDLGTSIDLNPSKLPGETSSAVSLKGGQEISAKILSFGPLGASVVVLPRDVANVGFQSVLGMITQTEISLFREARGGEDVIIGDVVPAFVLNVREDGKVDVGLRPSVKLRVDATQQQIIAELEKNAGLLPIGDKSDPTLIRRWLPGVSKKQFKDAVGGLYRDGIAVPSRDEIRLVPVSERKAAAAAVEAKTMSRAAAAGSSAGEAGRDPRILKPLGTAGEVADSVLVTGLPYKMNAREVAALFGQVGRVLEVQGLMGDDGRPSGRAIVKFAAAPPKREAVVAKEPLDTGARTGPPEAAPPSFAALTVPQLKERLRVGGLSTAGLKAELLERLQGAAASAAAASAALVAVSVKAAPAPAPRADLVFEAAMALDGTEIGGRAIKVRPYFPERPKGPTSPTDGEGAAAAAAPSPAATAAAARPDGERYRMARLKGTPVEPLSGRGAPTAAAAAERQGCCAFFGNLQYGLDVNDLLDEIEAVTGDGSVRQVTVKRESTQKKRS
jgi:hypothetical protein